MRAREDAHRRKRRPVISESAYFRAVEYGLRGDDALGYWLDAEVDDAEARPTGSRADGERGRPKDKKYESVSRR